MPTAKLTSRGQITIPLNIRNELKLGAGDRVEFVQIAAGRYEFIAEKQDVQELKGMFGKPTKAVSIKEMKNALPRRR